MAGAGGWGGRGVLQIYGLIQQADDLKASGKTALAKTKYQEAHTALRKFQLEHLDWNAQLVRYRMNYVVDQVNALSAQPSAAAAQTATTQVKLLEAGAEPRKVLRLHPKPGDKQTLVLTLKKTQETQAGGQSQVVKHPTITVPMDVTVKDVSANGDIACEARVGDASVTREPGVAEGIAKMIGAGVAAAKGMSGAGTVSSRGLSQGIGFKVPAGVQPLTREFVDQLKDAIVAVMVPLPEEAVGAGAKWEAKLPLKTQGMTIDQTATYEVVSTEGEGLTVKSTVVQRATNQKVENPTMPGMKIDLTQMAGTGTGECTFNLAHLLPAKAVRDSNSDSFWS